ncbi:hypothetical protein [Arthrobacter sp. AQ5-05]|uniref:hypothetical protein n=1 Tax=Arthrobacter sp. AQ5-05 TaxID=2184581 RepID=UPI0018A75717|nr:hypothetical protein [Arthrobacter sp. AQ5-05]
MIDPDPSDDSRYTAYAFFHKDAESTVAVLSANALVDRKRLGFGHRRRNRTAKAAENIVSGTSYGGLASLYRYDRIAEVTEVTGRRRTVPGAAVGVSLSRWKSSFRSEFGVDARHTCSVVQPLLLAVVIGIVTFGNNLRRHASRSNLR